jgi:hypothetical protein
MYLFFVLFFFFFGDRRARALGAFYWFAVRRPKKQHYAHRYRRSGSVLACAVCAYTYALSSAGAAATRHRPTTNENVGNTAYATNT